MKIKKKTIPQGVKILKCSWSQFDRDINTLVERMTRDGFKPKSIVCIATGGLCLGAKLRNILKLPLTIISTASYSGTQRQKTLMLNSSYVVPLQSPVLVVDDVADSGRTLTTVKEHLQLGGVEVRTATLFYKETSVIKPDWYLHKTNRWLVFPWENGSKKLSSV